jgi:hypothetical protein
MRVTALLLALLLPSAALAQSGNHNDGHSELHEYYRKLYIPDIPNAMPGSCCNERVILEDGTVVGDCRLVRAWLDDSGVWHAMADGEEVLIPDSKVIRDDQPMAPDGNSHLCMSSSGIIYCFVPGQAKI